ncbi:deoxyguanosinetriphosphate triphosphohydrolase [Thiomicrospira sp. XS5]|uniref:anti-phage deoxyguanosine triphosphatase n=1 Tax=Thiomicrospira sp. XS5 TaxID=1775636 RepID=UPI000745F312|nr:anti-phage deoxyguanosine triphosphatase [Thiomicrospira sp. XS5]KUJ75155.1 deoxyguanosinetriphosphate triphosphohydrolase [Thiomicrospira sp. XS5]
MHRALQEEKDWTQRYTDFLENQASREARIVYQRDRARVIHSASFRRLQAKTQIFGLNESDFYRTRLTHSMEVAQIGSGLVEQLITVGDGKDYLDWLPSFYLIEAICLAHDLGHPPYGHGGEVALNYMMRMHGGFEGNAQTLRILARLGEYTSKNGIDLSRRATLGVLKYPAVYDEVIALNKAYQSQMQEPDAFDFRTLDMSRWYPPKASVFMEEKTQFEWVLDLFSDSDKELFTQLKANEEGFHKTQYKALDTTIMELADDIAYGIHDLEDAVAMGMVNRELWEAEVMEHPDFKRYPLWDDVMTKRLFSPRSKDRKHAISKMVGIMVESVHIDENEVFEHPLLRYQAKLGEAEMTVLELLKTFVYIHVITLPEVKGMEYKGQLITLDLFKSLRANPQALLPRNTFMKYDRAESERDRQRVISDYIAGMTNTYASRMYEKFFTASQGSIFDRI